ncbi:MarR family winged helix-turn-helix transcriptional regulator [Nocardioides sp. InS609-2]|uniref:MarR family winged helix-turn-helix transcriptional regulator n=1 Tax=Nocardioides sp. InS609-2 TaxID=2760705 RepID=UPI0020C02A18|nr:MarR family winged helix-turn-helix transcriptional regulator [Nocardioides sp. InS609-2]
MDVTDERRLATEFDDSGASPGLLMWRATNAWQAAQRAALKPHDLTHVQFVLLASLVWLDADGPVTQKALAGHAGTDPMMTSQVLRALESTGLVQRRPHPSDARARAVVATEKGVALANRAVGSVEAVDRDFFGPLGSRAAELVELLAVLGGHRD